MRNATKKKKDYSSPRMALPGQDPGHEANIRAELVEYFAPVGPLENLWITDVAYCQSTIDHDRAILAAFKTTLLRRSFRTVLSEPPLFDFEDCSFGLDAVSPSSVDQAFLGAMNEINFVAPEGVTFLGDPRFAMLLGNLAPVDAALMRLLNNNLHVQMQERDRIINQIDRRRRQTMRDAIEHLEANSGSTALAATQRADDTSTVMDGAADVGPNDKSEARAAIATNGSADLLHGQVGELR